MRLLTLFLVVLLMSTALVAQQRYLVTPNNEAIPLTAKQSAAMEMQKRMLKARMAAANPQACTGSAQFGYDPVTYPTGFNFGGYHKDVLGQWYVAKASGTIDTVFWTAVAGGSIGAADSLIFVRIHHSILGPTFGPGIRPGPWAPPCQNWGYYINTNDNDQGVAAFVDDASNPPTWVSTITNPPIPATTPPTGTEMWGLGGYQVTMHGNGALNFAAMAGLGIPCSVKVGDKFFISQRVFGTSHVSPDTRTEWAMWGGTAAGTSDENYPSRDWKFYEHDSGPSNCNGVTIAQVKRGWVARGGLTAGADSFDVGAYNWWYVMTATTNTPPVLETTEGGDVHTTLSTADQPVEYIITDCDPSNGANAGVASAVIRWSRRTGTSGPFIPQTDVSLTGAADHWFGSIPGQAPGTEVNYRVVATDLGVPPLTSIGPPVDYRVLTLINAAYAIDTNYACTHQSIVSTGTVIDTSKFYVPPGSGGTYRDDGSWGPIDMGGPMTYFGDTARYAWIGVNGGLCISKTLDTVDANSNGFYAHFTFPSFGIKHNRKDTTHAAGNIPGNFIAPFWADLILGDTVNQYGHIRYGDAGNPCQFIAEWDSIGNFIQGGTPTTDYTTFRAILNKCDGTIEFQYDNVGIHGKDSVATVGMEADSTSLTGPDPAYVAVNDYVYPYETKPRNNWCIKFYPGVPFFAQSGWNMVSVATIPADYHKDVTYVGSVGSAFTYDHGYVTADPLANGPGYWVKYPTVTFAGVPAKKWLDSVTITIGATGWNMVGSISKPVNTVDIVQTPGSLVVGNYFGYGVSGYEIRTSLSPGQGFWVKTGATGTLKLGGSTAAPKIAATEPTDLTKMNRLTITDRSGNTQVLYIGDASQVRMPMSAYEMPPVSATGFDARFTSGRILEAYPSVLAEKAQYSYPIKITTEAYPILVKWEIMNPTSRKLVLTSNGKQLGVMEGTGVVRIASSSVKEVAVQLGGEVAVPKVFALGQNYPNPFNPTTRFNVDVPRYTEVNVSVYDVLGQKITTLMSGPQSAGSFEVVWDGRDAHGMTVPTGIYFIHMTADEFNTARKVVLMK